MLQPETPGSPIGRPRRSFLHAPLLPGVWALGLCLGGCDGPEDGDVDSSAADEGRALDDRCAQMAHMCNSYAQCINTATSYQCTHRPTLGVQRWDMYSGSSTTQVQELGYFPGGEGFLKPAKWHSRAPFFARRTKDVTWEHHPSHAGPLWFNYPFRVPVLMQAMDQEIDFAARAGIDYFIFNAPARTLVPDGWGLHDNLDAYLASTQRYKVNFVAALFGHEGMPYTRSHIDTMLDETVAYVLLPQWQKVKGGRPLIPVFRPLEFQRALASAPTPHERMSLAEFVQRIRQRVRAVGLPDPYIVAEEISSTHQFAAQFRQAGFDALSDYAGGYGGKLTTSPGPAPSYRQATQTVLETYDREFLGEMKFVPPAVDRFYPWPRIEVETWKPGWYYEQPNPGDLAHRITSIFDYVTAHPNVCDAQTVFMYSWNEYSEGGGLAPTMGVAPDYTPVTAVLEEAAGALMDYRYGGRGGPGSPIGWQGATDCGHIVGWACDPDDEARPLQVHIYADGPAGSGRLVASATASAPGGPGVAAFCGGHDAHRFVVATPAALFDGRPHAIYAYAINHGAGDTVVLPRSKMLTCAPR